MAMRWYSVSVLSNFEKKVAEAIKDAARQHHVEDEIAEVMVPTEDVIEIRRGKKADREAVHARLRAGQDGDVGPDLPPDHLINRVTGFLGPQGKPTPMKRSRSRPHPQPGGRGPERPRSIITFQTGEQVSVTDGPFEGFQGMVEEVDASNMAQGVGVDLRLRHPGRAAGVHAGRQGLVTKPAEGGGAPPDSTTAHVAPEGRVPTAWKEGGRHGQEGGGAAGR